MKNLLLLLTIAIMSVSCTEAQETKNIDSKAFSSLIKSGDGVVLDVRTQQEYSRGHIENSTLISTNDPKFEEKISLLQKEKPVYVYCYSGSRSRAVASYLSKNGFLKVFNLSRGLLEWQQSGYPLAQSENPMASSSKTYSDSDFRELLLSKNVVLVNFHAKWCVPCKKISPIIEKLQNDYSGKASIKKIDIEANTLLKKNYNVSSIPGLVLFKNGKEVWRHTGLISYADLSTIINKYI